MGTYLSTPVTEKNEESGESLHCPMVPVAWGVVDMQGWRKSMEDAHVAQTDIDVPVHHFEDQNHGTRPENDETKTEDSTNDDQQQIAMTKSMVKNVDAKVFGVFDGHGGPEVARFCQLYFTSVLTKQTTWVERQEDLDVDSTDENFSEERLSISSVDIPSQTPIGKALTSAFHALDRMIDDPNRREELIRLRAVKPLPGERHDAVSIPPVLSMAGQQAAPPSEPAKQITSPSDKKFAPPASGDDMDSTDSETASTTSSKETAKMPPSAPVSSTASAEESVEMTKEKHDAGDTEGASSDGEKADGKSSSEGGAEKSDDDSDEAVGLEEAAEQDRDMMDDGYNNVDQIEASQPVVEADSSADALAGKVSVMFQRLLNISSPTGQVVVQVGEGGASTPAPAGNALISSPSASAVQSPSASTPSLVRNGRLICNLPDHAVHAGATAVVAVIVGKTITVANAGDSRAVLCRNGTAFPLSFDHKPLQERELTRIRNAGGFVNHFGRVNGNLNLSRSIGDLKYKQVPGIEPANQMITAEPDIVQIKLTDQDEFILLGCDGIWDCLTNEKAVEYVRNRIDSRTPTQIGTEMLNDIISEDPRSTQGIGGDNMTIMIIDLKPMNRSYRKSSSSFTPNPHLGNDSKGSAQ